jgi:hypothetical protein
VSYNGDGPKKLMFFFTRTCPFCREQFPRWREILERVDSDRFEVIGLVDETEDKPRLEEYMRSMGCAADSHWLRPLSTDTSRFTPSSSTSA